MKNLSVFIAVFGLSFILLASGAHASIVTDQGLSERLSGYILLQVEEHGEAWYVNPEDGLRHYMKDGEVAYQMMRDFGLGITDADLETIPLVSSTTEMNDSSAICNSNSLANRLKGRILLQVEQLGEAWYIYPEKCRRIYMKNGEAAYTIMRFLGLGISNIDITKIPSIGDLDKDELLVLLNSVVDGLVKEETPVGCTSLHGGDGTPASWQSMSSEKLNNLNNLLSDLNDRGLLTLSQYHEEAYLSLNSCTCDDYNNLKSKFDEYSLSFENLWWHTSRDLNVDDDAMNDCMDDVMFP